MLEYGAMNRSVSEAAQAEPWRRLTANVYMDVLE